MAIAKPLAVGSKLGLGLAKAKVHSGATAGIQPYLMPIQKLRVSSDGSFGDANPGYWIHWKGVPTGVPVSLCIEKPSAALADMSFSVQFGFRRLELWYLLEALRYYEIYGKPVSVWLRVTAADGTIVDSNKQSLIAPIRPLVSPLSISSIERENMRYLTETATVIKDGVSTSVEFFAGRLLSRAMDGYRYFVYRSVLETDPAGRGFDCITFAMAMLRQHFGLAGKTGTAVVDAIGAQTCGLENLSAKQVVAAFGPPNPLSRHYEQFIAFSSKHVVLITGGMVYEFSQSRGQFRKTPGHMREWGTHPWTIRRIPENYRFAVS